MPVAAFLAGDYAHEDGAKMFYLIFRLARQHGFSVAARAPHVGGANIDGSGQGQLSPPYVLVAYEDWRKEGYPIKSTGNLRSWDKA